MSRSVKPSWQTRFSHIYVEDRAHEWPLTATILGACPRAVVVPIRNYREIFHRPNQALRQQKRALKLILAVKQGELVYPGSGACQVSGNRRLFYCNPVVNCIYACRYCYLSGKYPSANLVVFVNSPDFMEAVEALSVPGDSLHLALSYDTDLLALFPRLPVVVPWLDFARRRPRIQLEIRTKSTALSFLRRTVPAENILLAWSLSPPVVIREFERGTPILERRLQAAREAVSRGWKVRICIDPVLAIPGAEEEYSRLVSRIFEVLPASRIYDLSLGVFRMNRTYFERLKRRFPVDNLFYQAYALESGVVSYPQVYRQALLSGIRVLTGRYLPPERILVWE